MKKNKVKNTLFDKLRLKAAAHLKKHPVRITAEEAQAERNRILHELQIHKVELEMQNDELKKANEKAEEQRKKYTELYEFSPVGFFTIDTEGTILESNQSGAELLGLKSSELRHNNIKLFIMPEARTRFADFVDRTFKTNEKTACEVVLVNKHGILVTVFIKGMAPAGKNELNLNVFDITRRKQTEKELARAVDLLERTGKMVKVGGWELNLLTDELYWSLETYNIHEVAPDTAVSQTLAQSFYNEKDRMCLTAMVKRASKNGTPWEYEMPMITSKGRSIWVRGQGSAVMQNEKPVKLHGTIQDISEEKRLRDLAAEKSAEFERFAYTVSHDLKNPLTTIQGFAGLLKGKLKDSEDKSIPESIDYILKAGRTMVALLNDLLEISKIGRVKNKPEDVLFSDLVKEAVELMAGDIEKNKVVIEIKDKQQDACGCGTLMYCDRRRIVEVFQNLISNALKFKIAGTLPVLEIGCEPGNSKEYVCYVKDNGIGIESRYMDKIFGLFERLDNSVEGTGIGLAIVKRIVELHDGRIWVESEGIGMGSKFCFTLNLDR